jgi:hypothetical protein
MGLQAQQICSLARQEAKCPGFTAQSGQYLNSCLQDLCMNWDTDAAMGTSTYTTSQFNNLPTDYLRTRVMDGKDDIFYTISGVPYPVIQVTQAEMDWFVVTPGFQNFPQFYSTNLSSSPGVLTLWPPPSGQYPVTHRYQRQMPDIATPETSAATPWFPNTQILIRWTAGLLMGLTGDTRQAEYMGDDEERFPLGALTLLKKYLRNASDREGAVKTVGLDRRRFGRNFDRLKNTKTIGW